MISRIHGTLLAREMDRVEVMTPGGVGYELFIPLPVFERLPRLGEPVEMRVYHLVREDAVLLFGFLEETERTVFARLLGASGVGPRLALALLSALPAERLVRAIRDRDTAALTAVSGVGRKTAERMVLDLGDKLDDVLEGEDFTGEPVRGGGSEDALRALVSLGYSQNDAERAVRAAIDGGGKSVPEVIRGALAELGRR